MKSRKGKSKKESKILKKNNNHLPFSNVTRLKALTKGKAWQYIIPYYDHIYAYRWCVWGHHFAYINAGMNIKKGWRFPMNLVHSSTCTHSFSFIIAFPIVHSLVFLSIENNKKFLLFLLIKIHIHTISTRFNANKSIIYNIMYICVRYRHARRRKKRFIIEYHCTCIDAYMQNYEKIFFFAKLRQMMLLCCSIYIRILPFNWQKTMSMKERVP